MRVLSPPDTLRSGGNSLQTPDDWIGRIQDSALALAVADREADIWACLQRWPLGHGPQVSRPNSPVMLALPADWQEHPVLRHTAWELAGKTPRNSWRAEIMRSVHRSKTRGPKCVCCAATSLPLGADWPQRPLTPMTVPPLQADHPLTPWPR